MTDLQDRLGAALHATAHLIPDHPRPLPAARPTRRRLLIPAWAALAAATALLTPALLPDHPHDPIAEPPPPTGAAPAFYTTITPAAPDRASRWESRATATGTVLGGQNSGPGEEYLSIAAIPDDGNSTEHSFYLLTKTRAGLQPACSQYTVYTIRLGDDGHLRSWGTTGIDFPAATGTPAHLATTPKGDEIAYTYQECTPHSGMTGTRISHHWKDTTTTWSAGGRVLDLAYTPDGQGIVIFRQRAGHRELLINRTHDPDHTTTLLTDTTDALPRPGTLLTAALTPDGEHITAILRTGTGTLRIARLAKNGDLLDLTEQTPPPGTRNTDTALLRQHPAGPELLLETGGTLLLPGTAARPLTLNPPPTALAW